MNKLNAGKASVLVLTIAFAIGAFLLGRLMATPKTVLATPAGTASCIQNNAACDTNSTDNNNGCCAGLSCVANNNGQGNGKCLNTSSPTPTPTPSPTATPTPTPTDPGDLCPNVEGVQTSIPEGWYRLDGPSFECREFQYGGPESSHSDVQGTGTGGQVLGASTMAETGNFAEDAYLAIMTLGGTLSAFGIKNFKKASK